MWCVNLHLEEESFWRATMRQAIWKLDGYRIARDKEWEQTRFIGAILINANSKRKVNPKDLIPLSIDQDNRRTITEEEKELIRKNWMKNGRAGRRDRS
jgi:hypothetical protein